MQHPRVTEPLFADEATGPIKGLGHFRNTRGKFTITDKPPGNPYPVTSTDEMRQAFRNAKIAYEALPLTKSRYQNGPPIWRQPTWGKFWQNYWAIYKLGGVFTGNLAVYLQPPSFTSTGSHAATGDALLILGAALLTSNAGQFFGIEASATLMLDNITLDASNDPAHQHHHIRADLPLNIESLTTQAAAILIYDATAQIELEDITLQALAENANIAAQINQAIQDIGCAASAENNYIYGSFAGQLDSFALSADASQ